MPLSKIHRILLRPSQSTNLNPDDFGSRPYDYRIERFAKTYPYTIKTIPENLKNWYRFGLSNFSHLHPRLQAHDFSERAGEVGLLPDATAIVMFHIREVMEEFKDDIPPPESEDDEGTIKDMIDLAKARNAVRLRVNPYLKADIEDADFSDIIDRFEGGSEDGETDKTDFPPPGDGDPTEEEEKRRITFTDLVLTSCSGNYKTDRAIFEEMLNANKGKWNPTDYDHAWHIGVAAEFDSMERAGPGRRLKDQWKQKIKIKDFDDKYRGNHSLIPYFQGAKGDGRTPYGLYKRGYGGFVYLEKNEVEAMRKKENLTIQICMFKVRLTDKVNLYPYVYDSNTIMYDGKILKEDVLEKFVYHDAEWNHFIYDENSIGGR